MKIRSVEILLLKRASMKGAPYAFVPVVCRVHTDEGIHGCGEAGIALGTAENGLAHTLADLSRQIIGRNPMDNEVIWEDLHNGMYGHLSGGGAMAYAAMSALDTALLDIKGKALHVPVYMLLGGKRNPVLPCYLSQAQNGYKDAALVLGKTGGAGLGAASEYAYVCKKIIEDGFSSIKLNLFAYDREGKKLPRAPFQGPVGREVKNLMEERLEAIRDSCGWDVDLILENLCITDLTSAAQLAGIAEKYGVLFLEEPVSSFNPDLYRTLSQRVNIPLAAGEKVRTRWEFYQLLKTNAISVIQPDISNTGGLSEAKKICDMAQIFDAKVQAHVAGTPIATAAALHLEAAVPNFYIHEFLFLQQADACREYGTQLYEPVNGKITVPDLPGIGQDLSEKAIQEATARLIVQ